MIKTFRSLRDTIHAYEHDTRMILAITTMGVVVVAFFFIWASALPNRLIVLAPSPNDEGTVGSQTPIASAPYAPSPRGGAGSGAGDSGTAAAAAPTPIRGVGEIFGGMASLFAPSSGETSPTFGGMASVIARGIADILGAAADMASNAADFLGSVFSPHRAPGY